MNQDDLKTKIIKDIKKSGFLSEMKTSAMLIKNGWSNIHAAETFLDKDFNKSREIDITTYKAKYDKEYKISLGIHLIIEIKKTSKPWIIFCQESHSTIYSGIGWGHINFADNITPSQLSFDDINLKNRHANSHLFGTSYYEAFKKPTDNSQVYSALMTCCKAAVHSKKLNSWAVEENKKYNANKNHDLDFFLPIVVLDGLMFQSTLDTDGEISLKEVDYSPITLNYSSMNYKETTFYPEIITLKGLKTYLEDIDKWRTSMYNSLKRNISGKL